MSPLKVICPKCYKGQQIVVNIPLGGVDHVCLFCKTAFRVRPPSRPSSDDLPAARETVPKPTDLPVPRETVPQPGDLPVDRATAPRPGDLPVDRAAVPRPGDLPVDRAAVPRPGDLPVDRAAVPRPGDLPVDRTAVPQPGDLPVDRAAVPQPGDLPVSKAPSFGSNLPVPSFDRMPAKTPPLGLALELSFADVQKAPSGNEPSGDPLIDSFDLGFLPPPPPAPSAAPSTPVAKATPDPSVQDELATVSPPRPSPSPDRDSRTPPPLPRSGTRPLSPLVEHEPPPASRPTLKPLVSTPADSGLQLDTLDPIPAELSPSQLTPPARTSGARENLDLGFSLELEGEPPAAASDESEAIPFPSVRVASEGMAEAAAPNEDELPALAPPTRHGPSAARAMRPVAKKKSFPRWSFFLAGGVAVALLASFVLWPLLHSAPSPDVVIKPFLPELAKDNLSAYQKAATALTTTADKFKDTGIRLRLRAAGLMLVSFAAHGGSPADVTRAEQLLEGANAQPKLAPVLARVRALLAVAKDKPREVTSLLTDASAVENQLILGLARLADDKSAAAVEPLRGYIAARPAEALPHYLLGKALLASARGDARKEFELVLAKNPAHPGAMIGLARLEENPEKRLATARELADKKLPGAGTAELADLQLLIGESAQALGHAPLAIEAFQRAVTLDKRLIAAHIALGESLLYEGKYTQALERLKGPGPALEKSPAGKFSLGGALIATGNPTQGLALVSAASKERPDDPRGPFWTGFAASAQEPPDLTAAEQGYRDAIKRDPKFLPASLRLAALLQQQDKAEDSLAVLRAAEEAGAPPAVLQLAWGDALIVAKEPVKAEEIFQKVLQADANSIPARLGVAAALEAQGKFAEAKASLESTLTASPETPGLRERIAQVWLRLGNKEEALARYQEELQAGHATTGLRLAVARLALDLDKLELVQSEAKKIFDESPRSAEAAFYMARAYEARNENGAALQEYRHATTWGNTPEFALAYGRLLDKIGKQSEALQSFANALALPAARMDRGRIYFRSGDLESALADFQAAAKLTPGDAEPLILQGLCFDKMGQASKAEEAWREAVRVDADAPEPHYRLGRMELDRAKPASAIEHLRKAAAKATEQTPWRVDVYFQLAQAELLTGAKAAALADFKKFLDIAPPNAPTRPEATQQVARLGGGKKK